MPEPAVSLRAVRPRLLSALAGGALPVAVFDALQDYAITVGPGTQKLVMLLCVLIFGYGHVDRPPDDDS